MAEPEDERWRYSIATDNQILDEGQILALAGQLDAGA
jgi:hypothetical protein